MYFALPSQYKGEEIQERNFYLWKLDFSDFKNCFYNHRVQTAEKYSRVLCFFSLQLFCHCPSYPFFCRRDPDIKRRKTVYDLKARLFKIGCHI